MVWGRCTLLSPNYANTICLVNALFFMSSTHFLYGVNSVAMFRAWVQ